MASDCGSELASDRDDTDSLFGGGANDGDDFSSLFIEENDPSSPAIEDLNPQSEITLTPGPGQPEPANSSFQLTLPKPSAPGPTLILPIPMRRAEASEPGLPTVPDPPGVLLSSQVGHTSGDLVVSTQNFIDTSQPALAEFDEAELEAEFEEALASIESAEQDINSPPEDTSIPGDGTSESEEDALKIAVKQIPGFRYANAMTNSKIRLPRRIDDDVKKAELLAPYITLQRDIKMNDFYDDLQLGSKYGKTLNRDMRAFIQASPYEALVEQNRNRIVATKNHLINAAFLMLGSEGFGEKFFGTRCETASSRTVFWPADSAIIISHLVRMLYKVIYNARQARNRVIRYDRENQASSPGTTRASSPSSDSLSALPSPSPVPQAVDVPTAAPATPTTPTTPRATERPVQQPRPTFDLLVKEANTRKRARCSSMGNPVVELEVPENARLTYNVYIRDRTDFHLLSVGHYRHTDSMVTHGAFSYLKSSLEMAGQVPQFEILTPYGVRVIESEDDWANAVISIYNRRRSEAQVEVDIFV
ncbi:hypothetical protein OQA88_422 [Cercophora sp. LCS_1]